MTLLPNRRKHNRVFVLVLGIAAALVLLLLVAGGSAAQARGQVLHDVALQQTADGFSIALTSSAPVTDYHLSYLSGPYRLVADFPGTWTNRAGTYLNLSNDTVANIVVGVHPDRLRMTVHIKGSKILCPFIEKTADGIVFRVRRDMIQTVE